MGWRRMSWSCRLSLARLGMGEDGFPCVVFSRSGEGEDRVVL